MPLTRATVKHRPQGIVRLGATLTTDASGVIAATSIGSAFGRIVAVEYAPGTLATGADITIRDQSGAAIVTLTDAGVTARRFRPSAPVTSPAGVAITAAATATDVDRDIYVAGTLTVEVAQGGNALTGSIAVIVDENMGGGK